MDSWAKVDHYFSDYLLQPDKTLSQTLRSNEKENLPAIDVSANQGKLLQIYARMINAKRILEIGTLGGYSTIWMAQALPSDGKLITLEFQPKHAAVAKKNIENAGLGERVEIRIGKALDHLPVLAKELDQPFDLIFIDADKANNPNYFSWALKMSRKGSVIIVDNVVRGGAVLDAGSTDPNIQGVRKLNELIRSEPRVSATVVQTVGTKGWDGYIVALVTG